MTANIYVHAIEALQRDAAARIGTMLGATVTEAVEGPNSDVLSESVLQRCHTPLPTIKKARGYGP